jgi:hypothetical protein
MRQPAQRTLNGKVGSRIGQTRHFVHHQSRSCDGSKIGPERRHTSGDQIRVDEMKDAFSRQEASSESCLAGAIWTGNQDAPRFSLSHHRSSASGPVNS